MRHLQLTHEEIEIIKDSLASQIFRMQELQKECIESNWDVMAENALQRINTLRNLFNAITNSEKDF